MTETTPSKNPPKLKTPPKLEAPTTVESPPSPSQSTSPSEPSQSPTTTADHTSSDQPDWDGIETGEDVFFGGGEGDANGPDGPPSGLLSSDDFYAMFDMAFHLPNVVLAGRGVFPLDSLPIKPEEQPQARAASDAIYQIALETPALNWLLQPESPWLQRALPIIIFAGLKAGAVRTEIRAKRAKAVEETEPPAKPYEQEQST